MNESLIKTATIIATTTALIGGAVAIYTFDTEPENTPLTSNEIITQELTPTSTQGSTPQNIIQKPTAPDKHFAEIDQNGNVLRVIVANDEFINSGVLPGIWVETDPTNNFRKNYAGIGFKYDSRKGGFIPPRPNVSATLDDPTLKWKIPLIDFVQTTTTNENNI